MAKKKRSNTARAVEHSLLGTNSEKAAIVDRVHTPVATIFPKRVTNCPLPKLLYKRRSSGNVTRSRMAAFEQGSHDPQVDVQIALLASQLRSFIHVY